MKSTLLTITTYVLIFNAISVIAHHGRPNFHYDVTTTLKGEVIEYGWRNPHVYMELRIKNENNETEIWLIEGGTPTVLKRQGWKKESIKMGDSVVVVGYSDRNPDKNHMLLEQIVFENGEKFSTKSLRRTVGSPSIDESIIVNNKSTFGPSQDFSGTWARGFEGPAYFLPPNDWPLTKVGAEQVTRFDHRSNPSYDCLERGLPFISFHPYSLLWTRYADRIEIILQNSNVTRTLNLNQDKHPDGIVPSQMGHSIARIDDEGILMVDTVGFLPDVKWGLAPGLGSSAQKRVIESYTLSKSGLGMDILITAEDPVYLTESVTITGSYFKVADTPFEPYVCDLEDARRSLSPPLATPQ